MQSLEKCHECSGLCRAQILCVRGHVATTLNHLANELVLCEPQGNTVEGGASLPAYVSERMTITALLYLKHQRALPLKCGCAMNKSIRYRIAAPRVHVRTPRCKPSEVGKGAEC